MNGDFEPIWKELPLPSEEDQRLFEEWVKKQEQEREKKEDDQKVIVIDL
jgi:hypothetical protein|tara:strand:- start:631 stop:777 length:147 start_codon:yes stop_codon:yes gene_type:complete